MKNSPIFKNIFIVVTMVFLGYELSHSDARRHERQKQKTFTVTTTAHLLSLLHNHRVL